MSAFITLTPHPLTITLAGKGSAVQPLWTVPDISRFDILDLELGMLFLSSEVSAVVQIETSMQNHSGAESPSTDWLVAGQFPHPSVGRPNAPPNPQWQKLNFASGMSGSGLLKFVRWRLDLSAAGSATFFIRGIARRWGR